MSSISFREERREVFREENVNKRLFTFPLERKGVEEKNIAIVSLRVPLATYHAYISLDDHRKRVVRSLLRETFIKLVCDVHQIHPPQNLVTVNINLQPKMFTNVNISPGEAEVLKQEARLLRWKLKLLAEENNLLRRECERLRAEAGKLRSVVARARSVLEDIRRDPGSYGFIRVPMFVDQLLSIVGDGE